ncbi:response regulator [Andreprevotia chitinilytica]|uniref:response regulator n=1 Tax=Andreprevotia chitinilytica TaxID=396808 RepID=UPI000554C708|nr:response regulator [Andreprevotia chitinilytica]
MSTPDILLAEDNPTTAELFVYALEANKSEATIRVVRDGVEVLDFLFGDATQPERTGNALPRLVLLDLNMPRLGGFEVLARLRADERTRTLPVVILSSSDDESDEREAYRLGANGYIKKPRGFKESRGTIAQIEQDWLKADIAPPG